MIANNPGTVHSPSHSSRSFFMRGRWISLSRPRRFLVDLLHLAARVPTGPVPRNMARGEVAAAPASVAEPLSWPALILKAFPGVVEDLPVLRRAYVGLPWPHLC